MINMLQELSNKLHAATPGSHNWHVVIDTIVKALLQERIDKELSTFAGGHGEECPTKALNEPEGRFRND